MALKIRLRRMGRKKAPHYRIVVAESSMPRDGRFVANVGHYNPTTNPATLVVDRSRALAWMEKGAQPTETVRSLFRKAGVYSGEPSAVESATGTVSDAAAAVTDAAAKAAGAVKDAVEAVAERVTGAEEAPAEAPAAEEQPAAEAPAEEQPAAEAAEAPAAEEAPAEEEKPAAAPAAE